MFTMTVVNKFLNKVIFVKLFFIFFHLHLFLNMCEISKVKLNLGRREYIDEIVTKVLSHSRGRVLIKGVPVL